MQFLVDGETNMIQKKFYLSAIIIAKNEQDRIAACMDALGFCDEIVVVDNQSTDQTVHIAKKFHAVVVSHKENSFAALRNFGTTIAKGEWLLFIDADEIISDQLAHEIEKVVQHWKAGMAESYVLYRKNYYLHTLWPRGEWMKRLFIRRALVEWKGNVHETPITIGSESKLSSYIIHDTHRTLEQMVAKTNEWSDIEAKLRFDAHHPAISSWRLFRVCFTGFWDSYIKQGGWKAGVVGWIESMYQGYSLFITYAKLWELQEKRKK